MKLMVLFLLALFLPPIPAYSAAAKSKCSGISILDASIQIPKIALCYRGENYFSKNCYAKGGCKLTKTLLEMIEKGKKTTLVSVVGSPNYKLCYAINGTPTTVTFRQFGRDDRRIVCVADDGSFMESETLLEIYYSLSK